ncbi:MAG: hypothetical protein IPI56_07375 [Elusimicrobia bacterium]|nr:hypothetical protein [Elusimicrobiota bacterium]
MLHDRAHIPLKMPLALLCLFLAVSLGSASLTRAGDTWDGGYGSPEEACRNRVNEEGAFRFSRAEVNGNVAYCFTIAKKDGKDEYHDASVTRDEPVEEPKKDEEDGNKKNPAPEPAKASAPPPAASKDAFPTACIEAYGTTEFETEIDDAYKAKSSPSGNVAVLEWTKNGMRKTQWFNSSGAHSEQNILAYMTSQNIPKEAVTRIFTELSPCQGQCLPALSERFEGVRKNVTLQFHWIHSTGQNYKTCGTSTNGKMEDAKPIRQAKMLERFNRVKGK